MAFQPTTYQVLIAAPGDLQEEIAIAERVMHQFRLMIGDDPIRLEPLQWKKDARPDIHLGPQDAINQQLVDHGDMILAMFWTRRGTRTKNEESGTEEEVERFRTSGRPGMVYFSNRITTDAKSPDAQELRRRAVEQSRIEKLRVKYKGPDATHTPMFTGEFSTPHEFEIMLARHLDGMVRDHHAALKAKATRSAQDEVTNGQTPSLPSRQIDIDVSGQVFLPQGSEQYFSFVVDVTNSGSATADDVIIKVECVHEFTATEQPEAWWDLTPYRYGGYANRMGYELAGRRPLHPLTRQRLCTLKSIAPSMMLMLFGGGRVVITFHLSARDTPPRTLRAEFVPANLMTPKTARAAVVEDQNGTGPFLAQSIF